MNYILTEETLLLQKRAGIITESQYREKLAEFEEDGSADEKAFDAELMDAATGIAGALEKELKAKSQDGKELNEEIITATIAAVMTANAVVGFISKYSAKLMKKLNFKKGEDIAEKIHHWAHDNEKAFQSPIKRVLGFFIKDPKALEMTTQGIYAIVVGSMAAGYGAEALSSLEKAPWFKTALTSLKTLAKGDETIVNAFPVIKSLFT
jgi:hypothetical protein